MCVVYINRILVNKIIFSNFYKSLMFIEIRRQLFSLSKLFHFMYQDFLTGGLYLPLTYFIEIYEFNVYKPLIF